MTTIDPAGLGLRDNYMLFTSLVVPRPIGWLTTLCDDGTVNLAPFSFFNAVSANPPVVVVSIGERKGAPKDSRRNIVERLEFVVNVATVDLASAVEATSAELPYGVSEVEKAGLTLAPSERVRPPRVAESPVHLEARLMKVVELEEAPGVLLIVGRILLYHVRADLLDGGVVRPDDLRPLARLGAGWYAGLSSPFRVD